jgi:hypothetical protein
VYECRINATNTTASTTINFDSLGAKTIKLLDGTNAYIGALKIGMIAKFLYDGTYMVLLNPDTGITYGTWTPSVGGTATYTVQQGYYTKICNVVRVEFDLYINVIGTGSSFNISGLPFQSGANQSSCIGISGWSNLNLAYVFLTGLVDSSTTSFTLNGIAAAHATCDAAVFCLTSGSRIQGSGTYRV